MLHPVREHQFRGPPELAVVLQHEGVLEPAAVAGQTFERSVTALDGVDDGLAGVHPRGHGEVDALQPDPGGETQRCGITGDEQAVTGQTGKHRVAGLGDEVGGVLLDLTALDEWGDGRMGLEVGDDLLGSALLGGELGQLEDDADGQGVEVGVEESTAVHAPGGTDHLDVDAVVATHCEPLVDGVLGKGQGLLHPEGVVVGLGRRIEPGFLGQEAVHPITGDDHLGRQVAVRTIGPNPDHATLAIADQPGHCGRADEFGSGHLGVAGQPMVEIGAVGGGTVVRRLTPVLGAEVDGQRLGRGHHHRRATRDPSLYRGLVPPPRDQLVEDPRVNNPAVHVLTAGERAPLEQNDPQAGPCRDERRAGACRPGTDDDYVDVWSRHRGPFEVSPSSVARASRTSLASATIARSASCIIGQWGSVFTLMMWSGRPRPDVCCTAPEMAKAR